MNKKGFTLVELLAVLIIIGVLSTVAVTSLNAVVANSRKKGYKSNEKYMKAAAEKLLVACVEDSDSMKKPDGTNYCITPPTNTTTERITLEHLISANLISKVQDSTSKNYCEGYVDVKNTDASTLKLKYTVCLKCDNYKSEDCE